MELTRTSFTTTRQGLDTDLYPMQLWQKAKKLGVWDPAAIDFSQDREDWQRLADEEQDLILRLTAQFQGGEESVTYDLLPLLQRMAEAGRIEDEMFLTAYLWEEAKHVEGFDLFLRGVTETEGPLEHYYTPSYRRLFFEEQPRAMNRLRVDASPEALANASVTYQMITEGVLAETGYHAYYSMLEQAGILPGMQQLIRSIQRDEARHVAYGVYLLARLVAEHGDPMWQRIEGRMNELVVVAIQHIGESLEVYGETLPFGLDPEMFVEFGLAQFQKRHARIEKARGQTLDEVCYGRSASAAR